MRRGYDLGVIGEAEIIVRAEIDDRLRLAVVIDAGARFGTREKLGLVEFRSPFGLAHPGGEGRGGLKWIAGLASEKIAQAECCGVFVVHCLMAPAYNAGFHLGASI